MKITNFLSFLAITGTMIVVGSQPAQAIPANDGFVGTLLFENAERRGADCYGSAIVKQWGWGWDSPSEPSADRIRYKTVPLSGTCGGLVLQIGVGFIEPPDEYGRRRVWMATFY